MPHAEAHAGTWLVALAERSLPVTPAQVPDTRVNRPPMFCPHPRVVHANPSWLSFSDKAPDIIEHR